MKKRKAFSLMSAVLISGVLLSGCGETVSTWQPVADDKIFIAVAGDDEFYNENGVSQALALAAEDVSAKYGLKVEYKYFDDDDDYHLAITNAQEIAADPRISAVFSKQETDFIDTLADIYEEAEKPFFVMSGCYDHTILKGNKYFINDSICASDAGKIMGTYVVNKGFKRAVFCHSDTEYEESELRGFQTYIEENSGSNGTTLVGTRVGPYTKDDFEIAYAEWVALDVDVICVSNYFGYNSDLVRMLREKGSDIQVVSDYVMDTVDETEKNGEYLDGTVIVPLYMLNDTTTDIAKKYKEKYKNDMTEQAVQAYDFVMMTASTLKSGADSASAFMDKIKSEEGYKGLCGTVKFDSNGSFIPESDNVLVFRKDKFLPEKEAD